MSPINLRPSVVIPGSLQSRQPQLPTWGQLRRLVTEGENMVQRQGLPMTPERLFLAMLSIVTMQASVAHAETQSFWAFFPNPPTLYPATWDSPSVPIFVDNTWVLDGHPNGHLTPQWISFNYTRVAIGPPLCTGPQNITGSLKVQPINKTAVGGSKNS